MNDKNIKEGGSLFQYLIQIDKQFSSSLSLSASKTSPLGQFRPHMKFLEYSCHGAFWIPGAMIMIWFVEDPRKEGFFFNLLFGKSLIALKKKVIIFRDDV